MSAHYTCGFDEPACRDAREFGGKAAGLASLTAAGLPVAPGFAVGAAAYRAFLESSGLRPVLTSALARDATRDDIARRLAAAPIPDAVATAIMQRYRRLGMETGVADVSVAVRSSATAEDSAAASFAGEFETWVDVAGAEDVIAHVRRCWTSVFAGRAVDYARAQGVDPAGVEMAVVVQKTVRARAAGVMFTVSPVTGDRSRIVIEASWGLGLAVVGGEVTPDRWVVDKVRLTVVERIPGDKRIEYRRGDVAVHVDPARRAQPCLTDDQVIELARLGKRIEREQRCPQDIEFAVDRDLPAGADLVLLQRRPETVWSGRPQVPRFATGHGVTRWIGDAVTGGGGNTRTTAPAPGHQHEAAA
ncbi:MAG TPA: PEP/pyruvate-binding domain-containing protein [Pseudonocardiaceae bacterium]|jgi:pyruvate,water dikinase